MKLLVRARAAGYFKDVAKIKTLKDDSEIAAIRDRSDFKKLLSELETTVPSSK